MYVKNTRGKHMKIKTLQIQVTSEDYYRLKKMKGKRSWREVLLSALEDHK